MRLVLAAILVAPLALHAQARPAIASDFTDWGTIDLSANIAQGTIGPVGVTMSGGDLTFGIIDGSSTAFNSPAFCPPLPSSDLVELIGTSPALSYTITFDRPLQDPILHVRSLASTLVFTGVTLTKLCGQSTLLVSGNQISGDCVGGGAPPAESDANGTVKVNGTVSSLSFTAFWAGCAPFTRDGIHLQIGTNDAVVPALNDTWGSVKLIYR
jgi:hypothetical protein